MTIKGTPEQLSAALDLAHEIASAGIMFVPVIVTSVEHAEALTDAIVAEMNRLDAAEQPQGKDSHER